MTSSSRLSFLQRFLSNGLRSIGPRINGVYCIAIAIALIVARGAFEVFFPLSMEDFKGLIYVRDIAFLFPAGCAAYLALLSPRVRERVPPDGPLGGAWLSSAAQSPTRAAWTLAALSFLLCGAVSLWVLKTRTHIVDEANYLFQAKVFASGRLWTKPPELPPELFEVRYFLQQPDRWYSSFFPGQSALLALGALLQAPFLINPLLSAVLTATVVWAGRCLFSKEVGILAGGLAVVSPFLIYQGASYFSHIYPACAVTAVFVLLLRKRRTFPHHELWAGVLTSSVLLFRPLSALILGVFSLGVLVHQALRAAAPDRTRRFTAVMLFGMGNLPFLGAFLWYNQALTGDPFLTPHAVALPDEHLTLGKHSLVNTIVNMMGLSVDLLGVPLLSLLPLAAYLFLSSDRLRTPLLLYVGLHCLAYSTYPYHGLSYGPRFYFEFVPLLFVTSAEGMSRVLPRLFDVDSDRAWGFAGNYFAATALVALLGVFPSRCAVFGERGAYLDVRQLVQEQVVPPAIVAITTKDTDRNSAYLAGFQLNDATLESNVLYVRYRDELSATVRKTHPDHKLYLLDLNERTLLAAPTEESSPEESLPEELLLPEE